MKVTRKYIRNLVLEVISEMENNFDFMFSLGQILQVAQDNDIKIQGHNQELIDIDGLTVPSEGGFKKTTDGFPVYYVFSMSYDANNKSILYRLTRIAEANINNPRKKVDVIADVSVKTKDDADGLIGLIYAIKQKDIKYLDNLYQTIVMDNKNR